MKKITIVLFITLCIAGSINAQTSKKDWMVGGNFALNTANNNSKITFTPGAGYFVVNNLAVGGNLSIDYKKTGNNKVTAFGVGPFARYYFTDESQKVRPIVHARFNYLSNRVTVGNTSSTDNGTNLFLGGGAAIFISKNVSIDALIGYDRTKFSNSTDGGFAFNIGFQVYLLSDQVDGLKRKR